MLLTSSACDNGSVARSSSPSSRVQPLEALNLTTDEQKASIIENMKAGCEVYINSERKKLDLATVMAIGQKTVIRESLERAEDLEQTAPVVWLANFGLRRDTKEPAAWIRAVNGNRETKEVVLLLGHPNGTLVRVTYRRNLKFKDLEYDVTCFFPCELIDWRRFEARLQKIDGVPQGFVVDEGGSVPIPVDDNVIRCVAVRDRNGKLSNFLPLIHVDQLAGL